MLHQEKIGDAVFDAIVRGTVAEGGSPWSVVIRLLLPRTRRRDRDADETRGQVDLLVAEQLAAFRAEGRRLWPELLRDDPAVRGEPDLERRLAIVGEVFHPIWAFAAGGLRGLPKTLQRDRVDAWRRQSARKRGAGEAALPLDSVLASEIALDRATTDPAEAASRTILLEQIAALLDPESLSLLADYARGSTLKELGDARGISHVAVFKRIELIRRRLALRSPGRGADS
jgi:hypothetical protein